MKKIIFILVLATIYSCEISYDGEERLVVETQIIDRNGNPIPNQYVEIDNTTNSDSISYGTTNHNGEITLIFPSKDSTVFAIQVGRYNDPIYSDKTLSNLQLTNFDNYKIKVDPIRLYKHNEVTTLTLEIIHSSSNTHLKNIIIEGLVPDNHFNFNPEPPSDFYYPQNFFHIIKNQDFILKYIVQDYSTGLDTTYSINLSVVNDPINYTLNY